jgi:hypothetical protein
MTDLNQLRIPVTSSGLTTSVTAYSAGDQVGTQFTFANAAETAGGYGVVLGIGMLDKADIIGAYMLWLFRDSVTPAADNAAFSVSDTDMEQLIGVIPLSGSWDAGASKWCQVLGAGVAYDCAGTSLYGLLQAASAHTFFGAATDIILTLRVARG